jgi:predicted NAD/FAD-binding protein
MIGDHIRANLKAAQRTIIAARRLAECGVCHGWPYHTDDCPVGQRLAELLPGEPRTISDVWYWPVAEQEGEQREEEQAS